MIYIIRHGQTDWNLTRTIQGKQDISLNDEGRKQARAIKEKLENEPIDLIICSPLIRTKETAEIINKDRNLPIIYDERLEERFFGEYEGRNIKTVDTTDLWDYYKDEHYLNIESIGDLFARVYSLLDEILDKYPDKNILLVSHGGVSIPVYCYFGGYIPEGSLIKKNLILDNCEVMKYKR